MPHFHFPPLERCRGTGSAFAPLASLTAPPAAAFAIPLEGPRWPENLLATCHLKGE